MENQDGQPRPTDRVSASLPLERGAGQELPLVLAAMQGDHDALQRLWIDCRRWVAAILLAHKPRDASVDDLLQVVALQLCRKIEQVREPEAFRPWLRTVAINAARAEARKMNAGPNLRLTAHADTHPDAHPEDAGASSQPQAKAAQGDDAARLMALARTLPENYREPLLMRCVRGMSYRQIGAVLDLPDTTIETRIARGRRMLRELAEAKPPAGGGASTSRSAPSPRADDHATHPPRFPGASFAGAVS